MGDKLRFAELFAGCGGLTLGLKSENFEEIVANELSPMPAESYAYSLMGLDLRSEKFSQTPVEDRDVLWIDSSYGSTDVISRLNENPFSETDGTSTFDELDKANDFEGKLLVGDVRLLNNWVDDNRPLVSDLDLVSGGPPCQSFSLAGRREFDNRRNQLPWEFARFVKAHQPKIALLENVAGILRPFKVGDDLKHAWFEVAKAFATVGYMPMSLLVNAKYAGVAQNRPRFIMLAVRSDLLEKRKKSDGLFAPWFSRAVDLYEQVKLGQNPEYDASRWKYWDLTNGDITAAKESFLKPLTTHVGSEISVREAIDDLADGKPNGKSDYVNGIEETFSEHVRSPNNDSALANHRKPEHTQRVRSRFRLYQVLNELRDSNDFETVREVQDFIRGRSELLSVQTLKSLRSQPLLFESRLRQARNHNELYSHLSGLKTRKFSQKALIAYEPAPAALSIPDDVCHYKDVRTLSVREMARIQGFPDEFVFRGIATTGGARRAYQVPQYTQVGNAVPPILGKKLGQVVKKILTFLDED